MKLQVSKGGLPRQPLSRKQELLYRHHISALCMIDTGSPIGDGLCGERVARTPSRCPFSRGTCTLAFMPLAAWSGDQRRCRSVLQWKMYRTHTCEYCSKPSKHPMGMSGLQKTCALGNCFFTVLLLALLLGDSHMLKA